MENQITIREAATRQDVAVFWDQLHTYFRRDIFPDPSKADLSYFLGSEYRAAMEELHDRPLDRCRYLLFQRKGLDIGFALPVIYTTEDCKCFIMEFCVYPPFRGCGTGKACAAALLSWTEAAGARYWELNFGGSPRRAHFWQSVGFLPNGTDQWGEPLMLLPPKDAVPFTVEMLSDPEDWQLKKLENGFLTDIGESPLSEEQQIRLSQAVTQGKITFFLAKRGYRAVGMCSVARCYSTFACGDMGVFDDFFVEPAFRKKGIARMLARAAQTWCSQQGLASLTVSCAPCDEGMYQALGFDTQLGATFAHITKSPGND